MIEKIAGFVYPEIVVYNGGKILNRVACMGKKKGVQIGTFTLQYQFKTQTHDRADITLQVSTGFSGTERRIPYLNRQYVHCEQKFPRILRRKDTHNFSAVKTLLLSDVVLSRPCLQVKMHIANKLYPLKGLLIHSKTWEYRLRP